MPEPVPPRHCMVVHAYYPLAETRVQREAEALVDAGYQVDVVCLRDRGQRGRERYRGVEVHRLPVRLRKRSLAHQLLNYLHFLALATVRLARLHASAPYLTVQVHNLPDFLVFCALVPKLRGVPVILDLHDLMPEFFAGRFGSDGARPWLRHLIRGQERLACRFADHVITVSEHWRRELIARGVPEHKCSVVMNVADERIFVAGPRPRRRDRHSFRLLYHGTITYRYGLDLAVQAVGLVRDDIPGIHLTILGGGDHVGDLTKLRRQLCLEDHVSLLDAYVPAEQLPAIIAGADLGVVPYRNDVFSDGLLPTKLMEYAAMGVPSVAARTTAIETYFKDTMVEFFEPGDAEDLARRIRGLYRDSERLARLAHASSNFTRRYNWTHIGAGYVALCRRLATEGRAPRRS